MTSIIHEVIEENKKRMKVQQDKVQRKEKQQNQKLYLNQEAEKVEVEDEENMKHI